MMKLVSKLKMLNDEVNIEAVTPNAILVKRCYGFSEFYTIIYKGDIRDAVRSLHVELYGSDSDYKEKPMRNGLIQIDTVIEAHRLKTILNADGKVLDVINCFKQDKYETNGQHIVIRRERDWATTQIHEDTWINIIKYGEDKIEFKYPEDMDIRTWIKDTDGNIIFKTNDFITMCGEYYISNKSSLFDIINNEKYEIDNKGKFDKLEQVQSGIYMKHNFPRYLGTGVTGATVVDIHNNKYYEDVTVYVYNNSAGVVVLKKEDKTILLRDKTEEILIGKVSVVADENNKTITLTDENNNKSVIKTKVDIRKVEKAFIDISNRKG